MTYTDNAALAPSGDERARMVWDVSPSLRLSAESARASVTAQARLDYFFYSGAGAPAARRVATLSANGSAEVLPDWIFAEASAAVSQQPVSAFAQGPGAPAYSAANRAEVRSWRWSPYLAHRFGTALDLRLRYSHDEVSGDAHGFGRSRHDSVDVAAGGSTGVRRVHWNAAGHRDFLTDGLLRTTSTERASGGLRWNVIPVLSVSVNGGYDRYDFQTNGGATRGTFRALGVGWQPSARTSVEASVGRRFFGRSDSLAIEHRSRSTVWNIGYSADVTTMRSQFALPATLDTAKLLDQLFRAMFPDPAERARAVADYIATSGLPPSLTDSVSYLSNRYILQRQWQGAVALRGARTQAVLALVQAHRRALSAFEADSRLLGTSLGRMHDETLQSSAQVFVHADIGNRTSWNVTLGHFRSESLSDGVSTASTVARLGVARRFGRAIQGSVEARTTRGSLLGSAHYRENALTFGFQAQF